MLPNNNRLSAAVGVSCGVGLLRVATAATFATITILRMGRVGKAKQKTQEKEIEQNPSSVSTYRGRENRVMTNSTYGENDHDNDQYDGSDTHMTSDWDEHHYDQDESDDDESNQPDFYPDSRETHVRFRTETTSFQQPEERKTGTNENSKSKKKSRQIDPTGNGSDASIDELDNCYIDPSKDPSNLMAEIVQSAWDKKNETVATLVDLLIDQVELRERALQPRTKRERRDNPPSTPSDSDYLP
jgi:hypothetical protein